VRPDLDKYLRSTGDAMTGTLYVDDSRIVEIAASKRFGATPGARIRVSTIEGPQEELPL
jgi:Holliday junction resolvase RusA-like endonuclease